MKYRRLNSKKKNTFRLGKLVATSQNNITKHRFFIEILWFYWFAISFPETKSLLIKITRRITFLKRAWRSSTKSLLKLCKVWSSLETVSCKDCKSSWACSRLAMSALEHDESISEHSSKQIKVGANIHSTLA